LTKNELVAGAGLQLTAGADLQVTLHFLPTLVAGAGLQPAPHYFQVFFKPRNFPQKQG